MTLETYRILHVVGLCILFLGLGAMFAGGRKSAMMVNGLGLLVVLVSGFGMQAKGQYGFPAWVIAMIGTWVVMAVLPVLAKRKVLPNAIAGLAALGLVAFAAWIGLSNPKPF